MLNPETEIVITHNGEVVLRQIVTSGDYVVGREPSCDVPLDFDLVSSRHARLTVHSDHALIEDLGSDTGTLVDGQPITKSTRLLADQIIQIGEATIKVVQSDAETMVASDESPVQSTPSIGRANVGRYEMGEVVAKGGMGAIINARDAMIARSVAMKVMLRDGSTDAVRRFMEEAKITGQLEHPNIVPVHELAIDDKGQPYYTLKFVRGITLKKVLELLGKGIPEMVAKYPQSSLLTVFQKVCDAVAFAHSKNVIHRDLKPENVMIGDYGEVLLMDWGLAKVVGSQGNHTQPGMVSVRDGDDGSNTMDGTIMGTPRYMSPEQARGEVEKLDARSDIYSLGTILFELLYLRPTISGKSAGEVVDKVSRGEVDWTPEKRNAPESLVAVCRKAMALKPDNRYGDVASLQRDIIAYQNGFATTAEHAGFVKQMTLLVRRHKTLFTTAAAAWAIITALAVWFVVNLNHERKVAVDERKAADKERDRAENALRSLKKTAPTFYAQARVVFEEGKFEAALEKIGYAIDLDESNADYHLFNANLRQSSQELAAAREGYRRVLALRPADAAARINLALCEKLLRESNGEPLEPTQQSQLLTALRQQRRLVEAAPLAAILDPDIVAARAAILARLREGRNLPGWRDDTRVLVLPDGTFNIRLNRLPLTDYSVLQGQPITILNLEGSGIADLSGLSGLPLKELNLSGSKATDLSPLRGMPLEDLDLSNGFVTDLSPLLGMKLSKLKITATGVRDLRPLAGMPLTVFNCGGSAQVSDLSPLRSLPLVALDVSKTAVGSLAPLAGSPLKKLIMNGSKITDLTPLAQCEKLEELSLSGAPVTDLSPLAHLHLIRLNCNNCKIESVVALRGHPLRWLDLGRTRVTDLSPLSECTFLEEIFLPSGSLNLSSLRKMPSLKRISTRSVLEGGVGRPAQTAEEFWREYDAQQKATAPK